MKTIFIPIASSAAFRNLCFFPGSFLDLFVRRLQEHPRSVRVVFILEQGRKGKYEQFFANAVAAGCYIEYADVGYPKRRIEKMFQFFYSYLLYTKTTALMATMGTRPDEPAAGGKRYLAPIKKLLSLTFGKSLWIRNTFVPESFIRINRTRPFQALFDTYHPDLIFSTHLYGLFDIHLLAEAYRRKVRTVGMPAGWDHLDKYFLPFHVDELLVPSAQVGAAAVQHQSYSASAIRVVGYPHFDFMLDETYAEPRAKLIAQLGLPDGAKYILYISGSAYCPHEPDIIETMLRWIDEGKLGSQMYIVIRPYISGRTKDRTIDEIKFSTFKNHPRVRIYEKEFWGDLEKSIYFTNILRHADTILAVYTTMVLEAALYDRPIIATPFDGYQELPYHKSIRRFEQMDHFKEVLLTGAMHRSANFDDLLSTLQAYVRDGSIDHEKREQLRRTVCGPLDRRTGERIVNLLMAAL